jgi:hypothetical protein
MKLTASNVLVATVGCVLLGGCSIFAPKRLAHIAPAAEQGRLAESSAAAIPSEVTDAGRALLDAGQPGFAINTFRKALAKNEAPGPALNGLGVAYARIGRQDLAAWYFKQAMVFDPAETRYAMNLERIMATAVDGSTMSARMADATSPRAGSVDQSNSRPAASPSVRRPARAEIKIVTMSPQQSSRASPVRVTAAPTFARVEFVNRTNSESKSRWVDVAPGKSRITHVGNKSDRAPKPTIRMAVADKR